MAKNYFFRSWFYFRQGWSTYFAFLFAAINTLTVTYYLAIENYPILHSFFPSFLIYVLVAASISIPLLILIGYIHYKKSNAFKAEADIYIESNPHTRRILLNTEMMLKLFVQVIDSTIKNSNGEKLTDDEMKKIITTRQELSEYINANTIDTNYYANKTKTKD